MDSRGRQSLGSYLSVTSWLSDLSELPNLSEPPLCSRTERGLVVSAQWGGCGGE